ncbi:MAG: hypothetical protein HGA37_06760 [Lentimicrobium sp.]|nr:hypothetical protein [Lentimicrobium sp.]
MLNSNIETPEIRLKKPICIGIGGVSRSGKTFLADKLNGIIADSIVIHQDTFIPDESAIPGIKGHIDWERPEAIDWDNLKTEIERAIQSGKTVIVEGLFAFNRDDINTFYNKSIFIKLSKKEFIRRKRIDLRWGAEPAWYILHIWKSHKIYGQLPSSISECLLLNGEEDFDLNLVLNFLKK